MTTFEIDDSPANLELKSGLGGRRSGSTAFTVHNRAPAAATARFDLLAAPQTGGPPVEIPPDDPRAGWFTIAPDREQRLEVGARLPVTVNAAMGDDAPPGDHTFYLRVVNTEGTDDDFVLSQAFRVSVPSLPPTPAPPEILRTDPQPRKFPWPQLILLSVVLIGGASGLLKLRHSPGSGAAAPRVAAGLCQWRYSPGGRADFKDLGRGPPLAQLRFGDFDGDRRTDVFLVVDRGDGSAQWMFSRGGQGPLEPLAVGPPLAALRLGDFDGDRRTDVFTATARSDGSSQWRFSSGGTAPFKDLSAGPPLDRPPAR